MLNASVSGSFHRHMHAIYDAVGGLRALAVNVLSPSDPRVVDSIGEFLFVASDRLRSIRLVEDRHLEAIRASDFLWVVCPDGYTGASTSGEILAAHVLGVPAFSVSPALDITIGQYVRRVASMRAAVEEVAAHKTSKPEIPHLLIDPEDAIARSIDMLEKLRPSITGRSGDKGTQPERQLKETRWLLRRTFGLDR
jgi:hypothetical protein